MVKKETPMVRRKQAAIYLLKPKILDSSSFIQSPTILSIIASIICKRIIHKINMHRVRSLAKNFCPLSALSRHGTQNDRSPQLP